MKKLSFHLIAVFLMLAGGILLVIGAMEGQGAYMMFSAALALLAGVVALLIQFGHIGKVLGNVLGITFAVAALTLAYLNYHETHRTPMERTEVPSNTTNPSGHGE